MTDLDFPGNFATVSDNHDRLYIVDYYIEKIHVLENGGLLPQPFLDFQDVREAELAITDGETGLIGLAFPPGTDAPSKAYVTYTGQGNRLILSRFMLNKEGTQAIRSSEEVLLAVENFEGTHHCGDLRFGPDGFLYVCVGDFGVDNSAQDLGSLNGSILRIDVESQEEGYAIPGDNPLVDVPGARPEIWVYGVRNPWRFAFGADGDVYVADPGSKFWEELTLLPAGSASGANLGWPMAEGNECVDPCTDADSWTWPVHSYPYGENGCSIIGGVEYRGEVNRDWQGVYVFGDFCTGDIWGLRNLHEEPEIRKLFNGAGHGDGSLSSLTSIGEGPDKEILVAAGSDGGIYRFHFPDRFDTDWLDLDQVHLEDLLSVERAGSGRTNKRLRRVVQRWQWTQPFIQIYGKAKDLIGLE